MALPTTSISLPIFAYDTGAFEDDLVTNVPTQVISGQLSASLALGERLYLSVNDGASWDDITSSVAGIHFTKTGVTLSRSDNLRIRVQNADGTGPERVTPYVLDTIVPSVVSFGAPANKTYVAGESLDFTVAFSEDVTVTGSNSTLDLGVGTSVRQAYFLSASGNLVTYRYTVQPGDIDANGIAIGSISLGSTTIRDLAGNNAILSLAGHLPSTAGILIDAVTPSVSGSVVIPAEGYHSAGDGLTFTVTFDDDIVVSGNESTLNLTIGSTARSAALIDVGRNFLTYSYTVQAGDQDHNGITVGALSLNGSTIRDASGNDASISLVGHIPSTVHVMVDATPPTLRAISVPDSGYYSVGEQLSFTLTFDEAVSLQGTNATLDLVIGGAARSAVNIPTADTETLIFAYTLQAGDTDVDGIDITGLSLNGSTIRDIGGNNADLTLAGLAPTLSDVRVDTTAPTVAIASSANFLRAGETANITFVFSEAPVGFTSGDVQVSGGTLGAITGSGVIYTAVFTPTPGVGSGTATVRIIAGAYEDQAGNSGAAGAPPVLEFDTLRPTVSITSTKTALTAAESATLTFTFSEAVSSFTLADLVVTGGALSGFATLGDQRTYSVIFTADGAPNASVSVNNHSYADLSGNLGSAGSLSFTTPPAPAPDPEPEPPQYTAPVIREAFAVAAGFAPNSSKALASNITLPDGTIVANPAFETAMKLAALIASFQSGAIGRDQLIDGVVELSAPTSGVALSAYQFFTGATPSAAGMAWLIDSPDNTSDLTDPYYARFNEVNRFINFAVNLGTQGEGKAAFEAKFGALDFAASVRLAYDMIIGLDAAAAAGVNVSAALSWIASQEGYFDAFAGSDLGGKAAMVGYIMQASFEAKVGRYYEAAHGFTEDSFDGAPAYEVDLVGGQHLGG